MSSKIVVPEGMLKATENHFIAGSYTESLKIRMAVLEAALRWLSENPIVPSDAQVEMLLDVGEYRLMPMYKNALINWQRRMFLAPEPEIPPEIEDLLGVDWQLMHKALYKESVLEAFNRGRRVGGK